MSIENQIKFIEKCVKENQITYLDSLNNFLFNVSANRNSIKGKYADKELSIMIEQSEASLLDRLRKPEPPFILTDWLISMGWEKQGENKYTKQFMLWFSGERNQIFHVRNFHDAIIVNRCRVPTTEKDAIFIFTSLYLL